MLGCASRIARKRFYPSFRRIDLRLPVTNLLAWQFMEALASGVPIMRTPKHIGLLDFVVSRGYSGIWLW